MASHTPKTFAANQNCVVDMGAIGAPYQKTRDLEGHVKELKRQLDACRHTQSCVRENFHTQLAEAHEHRATLATALASMRSEHQAALASALASAQSKPERWCIATKQVLSSASDLIGTSAATQLLERIQNQVANLAVPVTTNPSLCSILLSGTTMYSGRGAPRHSDYRLPSKKLLKPGTTNNLYKLSDGSIRCLNSLSSA
jgi:ferritin-like metal-binding protein YciE